MWLHNWYISFYNTGLGTCSFWNDFLTNATLWTVHVFFKNIQVAHSFKSPSVNYLKDHNLKLATIFILLVVGGKKELNQYKAKSKVGNSCYSWNMLVICMCTEINKFDSIHWINLYYDYKASDWIILGCAQIVYRYALLYITD